ncbi:hypothetical protein COV06_01095 [Candidatus Uhrbacteria bacterium CG10_big_fil_rev_8_21_14_0_10_50_16]|uniref:Uncharacterized protein n=1 Tax=Candidatus Uhrbacteria bacterium CG10_big_fil_rev_8_21_14_0_10_50_16 TaxID=1975039 RepID=A0A2H0RN54_9BACT|nr:MAG: hypothetical protein COV06_01095 [Candidatus Uhrbacteria bacterium CG10_big_fil_rev_8_21_14_0_10_50_16]
MEGSVKKTLDVQPLPAAEVLTDIESTHEQTSEVVEQTPVVEAPVQQQPVTPVTPVAAPVVEKDPELVQVEDILSEGLQDFYKELPQDLKPAFKAKGEEVARTILVWRQEAKLVASRVLRLIREWLGMAPKLNKHYLEQESKIKTDHILALAESDHLLG